MNEWEAKWSKYMHAYQENVAASCRQDALRHFLGSTLLSTGLAVTCIIDVVENFPLKMQPFDLDAFRKKLKKKKKQDVLALHKFFLMDYLCLLKSTEELQLYLLEEQLTFEAFERQLFTALHFTKEEIRSFDQVLATHHTFQHSIGLLEQLGLGKEAKNEALVEATEILKNEFYSQFTVNFKRFFHEKND